LFIQRTRALAFFQTHERAYEAARSMIAGLTVAAFAHAVQLAQDVADVYGVKIENTGWYVKLTIDEQVPEVAVISFHPLEKPLKTNGGVVQP
jgi:hypothetical protein